MRNSITPNLSDLEILANRPIHSPLLTENREYLFKESIYDVYRVIGEHFDTYIATFGGKNAIIRDEEFLGVYPYYFLSLNHLVAFIENPFIEPTLRLVV